ncbi:hypothetical protein FKP32DRAFT_1671318 [Trametes sanguinea]|nr:hypothetical protein FKP32DRAFT_1671318 [Trametes sanguinea]
MGTVIPRSFAEWACAFAKGRPVDEIAVLGLPPRGHMSVKKGCYVTIKPDGTRRDDVNIQDEEWIAQVGSIAVSEFVGPIAKFKWFIRQTELSHEQCRDNSTQTFVASVGAMELLALQHETITTADTIHDIIPVETFDVSKISLRVLDPVSYYTREKIVLLRVLNTHYYRLAEGGFERACKTGCLYGGHFNPDEHVMRFCMACETWFHIPCMEHASERAPTLPPSDRPRMPAARVPQADQNKWDLLLLTPIQRGSTSFDWLLSFELLVYCIRVQEQTVGCPEDVNDFVVGHFGLAPHLSHQLDMFLQIFWNLPRPDLYYRCPDCLDIL